MKKITVVVLALSLMLCLESCNFNRSDIYTSLICDVANDESGVSTEIDFWTGEYFQKDGMKEKSCAVLGNTYIAEYDRSIIDKMNSYTTDMYDNADGITWGLEVTTENWFYSI